MEKEKEEQHILDELYSLRAGLSVISIEVDKIRDVDERTKKGYQLVADGAIESKRELVLTDYWQHKHYESIYDFVHGDISEDNEDTHTLEEIKIKNGCKPDVKPDSKEFEEQNQKAKRTYAQWLYTDEGKDFYNRLCGLYKYDYENLRKHKRIFGILALISFAAVAVSFIIAFVAHTAIVAPIICIGILGFFIFGAKWNDRDKPVKEAQAKYMLLESLLTLVAESEKEIAELEHERTQKIQQGLNIYSIVYPILLKQFSKLLDVRDWKYVDLIIFYLETGRADNLKEALLLVERESQTQRIIGAIETAAEYIVDTIKVTATRISAQLNAISKQLNNVLSLETMSTALSLKAAVTSQCLMDDINYLKGLQ